MVASNSPAAQGVVQTDLAHGVLTVRLNRAEAAHARNQQMRDELMDLWRMTARRRDVRAVVLTAVGTRHFCAGMDVKEAAAPTSADEMLDRLRSARDIELLAALPQPTIAAINGTALGGGLEMALACDLRLIASHAQVALPEVTIGLVPGGGATQRLPRLIGRQRATEMILTGRRLSAAEAVDYGVALRAVEGGCLADEARELAAQLASVRPNAARRAKELLRRSEEMSISTGAEMELETLVSLIANKD